jgi:hypothetical protein
MAMFSNLFRQKQRETAAFKEGALAFSNDKLNSDNPYHRTNDEQMHQWQLGWEEAKRRREAFLEKFSKQPKVANQSAENKPNNRYTDVVKHVKRLSEIEDAIGEIGLIFEREGSLRSKPDEKNSLEDIVESIKRVRFPGFLAYHFAQEGIALLHIIAAICEFQKESSQSSDSRKIDAVLNHIDKIEPNLRGTMKEMEPYQSLNLEETLEIMGTRFIERKRQ